MQDCCFLIILCEFIPDSTDFMGIGDLIKTSKTHLVGVPKPWPKFFATRVV
jgi:hypothetical protein